MAVEIERKFLLRNDSWRSQAAAGRRISQGYLCMDPDRTVRVRVSADQAWLTIKGRSEGISRAEFEFEIPLADADALLGLCLPSVIEKTRYCVEWAGYVWEIDEFHGENEGLQVAEIELADEAATPDLPAWVGDEVSNDSRYFNSCLANLPLKQWPR
jgi:adenylate cyclase